MDGLAVKWVVIGTAAAIGGLVLYKTATKGAAVVKTLATETLNPASDKNIVNAGVTQAGAAITGDKDWTLGGWVYDLTHGAENKALADSLKGSAPVASYDEGARLLARYPAPVSAGTPQYDAFGTYLGTW